MVASLKTAKVHWLIQSFQLFALFLSRLSDIFALWRFITRETMIPIIIQEQLSLLGALSRKNTQANFQIKLNAK